MFHDCDCWHQSLFRTARYFVRKKTEITRDTGEARLWTTRKVKKRLRGIQSSFRKINPLSDPLKRDAFHLFDQRFSFYSLRSLLLSTCIQYSSTTVERRVLNQIVPTYVETPFNHTIGNISPTTWRLFAIYERLDIVLRKFRHNMRFSGETCESLRTFGEIRTCYTEEMISSRSVNFLRIYEINDAIFIRTLVNLTKKYPFLMNYIKSTIYI